MRASEKYPNLSNFFSGRLNQTAGYMGKDNYGDDLPYLSYEEIVSHYLSIHITAKQLESKIIEIDQILAENLNDEELAELLERLGLAFSLEGFEPLEFKSFKDFLIDLRTRFKNGIRNSA